MRFSQIRKLAPNIHLWAVPELVEHITPSWFDLNWWQQQGIDLESAAGGRGKSYFIDYEIDGKPLSMVWRHYLRGGKAALFSEDKYVWTGLDRSRPYQETFLTSELYERGLPVPKPLAAMVVRKGLRYSADFLTERLPDTVTLADQLIAGGPINWRQVGDTVACFHKQMVDHADLNARNILLGPDDKVYLIDFDLSFFRPKDNIGWRRKNLERLERSLKKVVKEHGSIDKNAYHEGWKAFVLGYGDRWFDRHADENAESEAFSEAASSETAPSEMSSEVSEGNPGQSAEPQPAQSVEQEKSANPNKLEV